jgi:hypothetical protein
VDQSMAAVESQILIKSESAGFDGVVTTIVRIRTSDTVAKEQLMQSHQEMFDEMRLPLGQVLLVGSVLDKKFVWQFASNQNLAAATAAKFLQLQKVGREWRDVVVHDTGGKKQRDFMDGDKNMHQIKCEMATKKFTAILKEQSPGKDFFAKRGQGQVCHKWLPLARLVDITADGYRIEWNFEAADSAGVNKSEVVRILAERDRDTAGSIEWG